MLFDMSRQCPEIGEYAVVLDIVGFDLEPVSLGDRQSDFQGIDRIEAQAFVK